MKFSKENVNKGKLNEFSRLLGMAKPDKKKIAGRLFLEELHPAAQERSAMSGSQGLLSRFLMVNSSPHLVPSTCSTIYH